MESKGNRTVTIAIVTGIIALLFGLCAGAAVGGISGYALGRRAVDGALRQRVTPRGSLIPTPARPTPRTSGAQTGVIVQSVVPGTPAANAGIQAGDTILRVDGTQVRTGAELTGLMSRHRPGDRVEILIDHFGVQRTVTVQLGSYPGDAQRAYLGVRHGQPAAEGTGTPTP